MSGRILSIGFTLRRIGYFRRDFSTGEQSLDHVKSYRDKKNGDARCGDHSTDDRGAKHTSRDGAGSGGKPKRQKAEDERKRSHQDRAKTEARAFEGSVEERFAFLVFVLGKFDDKDRVLRGQADEHDQTDLRVNIVLHS